MGSVGTGFSMSLDGFVAGPNDDVSHVFAWMSGGDTVVPLTSGDEDISFHVSAESAEAFTEAVSGVGALVTGRRLFDITGGWGGNHPLKVPIVVVTHHVPTDLPNDGKPFTFVTDGVESAIAIAKRIAGDKDVAVASPNVLRQCLELGLIDNVHVDLMPVLLGAGIRLIDHLGSPVTLERTKAVVAPGVTHLTFRVVK